MAQQDYPDNGYNISGAEDSMLEASSSIVLPAVTTAFIGIPSTVWGLDLAAHTIGLTVAYYDIGDESLATETYVPGGTNYSVAVLAAGAADDLVAPSLAVARNEDLYLAYHNLAEAVSIRRSGNFARTWDAAIATTPTLAGKHARLLITADRQYVALWESGDSALHLYGSTDYYANLEELATFTISEQAASLRQDRRGLLHLAYEDAGNISERTSADGVQWSDAATLVSGRELPAAGYGAAAGALFAWENGDTLEVRRSDGAFTGVAAGPWDVTDAYPLQVPGVTVDRRGLVWLALMPTGGGFAITDDLGRLTPDSPQFALDEDPV